MPICNLSDFLMLCPKGRCLLGLDPGSKIIGVAISDPDWRVASPLKSLKRGKFSEDLKILSSIINERNVGGIIIGLPKTMKGLEGPAAQSVRTFAINILGKGNFPVPNMPIAFWDERMSTAAVTRFMLNDDMSRKRRAETVDKAAAAYILQGALDALSVLAATPKAR